MSKVAASRGRLSGKHTVLPGEVFTAAQCRTVGLNPRARVHKSMIERARQILGLLSNKPEPLVLAVEYALREVTSQERPVLSGPGEVGQVLEIGPLIQFSSGSGREEVLYRPYPSHLNLTDEELDVFLDRMNEERKL